MEKPNVIPSIILLLRSRDTGGISGRFLLYPLVLRELRPEIAFGESCSVTLRPEFCAVSPEFCALRLDFCAVSPEFCALPLEF